MLGRTGRSIARLSSAKQSLRLRTSAPTARRPIASVVVGPFVRRAFTAGPAGGASQGGSTQDPNAQNIIFPHDRKYDGSLFSNAMPKPEQDFVVEDVGDKKDTEQLSKAGLIEEQEVVRGQPEHMSFQAETRQLLDIVAHSLYTDKEVFIRELISNASDALEKFRHTVLTGSKLSDPSLPLEIHIAVDETKRTFTITDSGIGMKRDELVKNLGTIAHSGSKQFVRKLQEAGSGASSIIGQFGVGFYSSFMVASKVRVYTRSAEEGSTGYCWESTGDGTFNIYEAEGVSRGTKIILTLKETQKEFCMRQIVERCIQKFSNFVGFPIFLNGTRVNTIEAIWMKNKSEVSTEQHKQFFNYLSPQGGDQPYYTLHFSTDVPLSIHALFYTPASHGEKYGLGKMDPGVNLYSRKVLIQSKARGVLPDWLRFVKGVVDSEDLPLNLSREHLQDSALVRKLNTVLTRRILKSFSDELISDPKKYAVFYEEFGNFLKEGICTDMLYVQDLAKLLIFETSATESGKKITLDQYIERMKPEQKEIYYLTSANRAFAESSPYYEAFKERNIEVLFLFGAGDDFVMANLNEYKKKKLVSIENANIDMIKDVVQTSKEKAPLGTLSPEQSQQLGEWLAKNLPSQIESAQPSSRLLGFPAIIVEHENASIRRVMRMVDSSRSGALPKQKIEFNPSHPIILKLFTATRTNAPIAKPIAEQIFDNALIAAGLLDDPRSMLKRINALMEDALQGYEAPATIDVSQKQDVDAEEVPKK